MTYIIASSIRVICSFFVRYIQHPNILCFLGAVRSEMSIIILTNYVEGTNLHTLIFDKSLPRVCSHKNHCCWLLFSLLHVYNNVCVCLSAYLFVHVSINAQYGQVSKSI